MTAHDSRNARLLIILASIAAAFFVGIIVKVALFGQ
jgi:hypothetical protein